MRKNVYSDGMHNARVDVVTDSESEWENSQNDWSQQRQIALKQDKGHKDDTNQRIILYLQIVDLSVRIALKRALWFVEFRFNAGFRRLRNAGVNRWINTKPESWEILWSTLIFEKRKKNVTYEFFTFIFREERHGKISVQFDYLNLRGLLGLVLQLPFVFRVHFSDLRDEEIRQCGQRGKSPKWEAKTNQTGEKINLDNIS